MFEDFCDALAVATGFPTICWTEGLGIPAMLWQWPQGLQLFEWAGLRIPAMLWQWPQSLQQFEGTEGLRTPAMLWQWPQCF